MFKKCIVTALVILALIIITHPVFSADKQEDYPQDLLYKVTFDVSYMPHAVYSKGSPKASLTADLGLRGKKGFRQNCLLLEAGEKCTYDANKNIDPQKGTISFWVKPGNWDKMDRMLNFIRIYQHKPKAFYIIIGKNWRQDSVRAYITMGSKAAGNYKIFVVGGSTSWDRNTWVKIDVTWDNSHIALYINGNFINKTSMPDVELPAEWGPPGLIDLVPICPESWDRHAVWSSGDRSYIDEVEIYGTIHSAHKILKRYQADVPSAVELSKKDIVPNMTAIPKCENIIVDGKLTDKAWEKATTMPIDINMKTSLPDIYRSKVFMCYDSKYLYFGFESNKIKDKLVAKQTMRDGKLWEDDCFELLISPGEQTTKSYYHWIINPKGIFYDDFAIKKAWQSKANIKAYESKTSWSVEMAIPFTDFKIEKPEEGDKWRANFCRTWYFPGKPAVYTSWSYAGLSYVDNPEFYGTLKLGRSMDYFNLDILDTLKNGLLDAVYIVGVKGKMKAEVSSDGKNIISTVNTINEINTRRELKQSLKGVVRGVLRLQYSDAEDNKELFNYSTSFVVKKPVSFVYIPDLKNKKLGLKIKVNLDKWNTLVDKGNVELDISIKDPEGILLQQKFRVTDTNADHWLPIEYKDGQYNVTYKLYDTKTRDSMTGYDSFTKPPTPWLEHKAGVSDKVLKPWTPLRYRGKNKVKCWGRSYKFNGPFLSEVINQNKKLLRAPMDLVIETDKGRSVFKETKRIALRRAKNKAEYKGKGVFTNLNGSIEWDSWMEFDGFTFGSFTLKPPKGGWNIKSLTLQIPLRKDIIKYVRNARESPLPLSYYYIEDKKWESGFEPYLFICNEDEGFAYICEEERNWVYPDKSKVTIIDSRTDAGIALKLISKSIILDKAITYKFGFQAAPIKPFNPGWRKHNFGGHRTMEGSTEGQYWSLYANREGTWDVANPEWVKKIIALKRKEGVNLLWYTALNCTGNKNPVYDFFVPVWENPYCPQYGPYNNGGRKGCHGEGPHEDYFMMPVCPGNETYIDYITWTAQEFLKKVGVTCLYTDCFGLKKCENKYHGHGFTDVFGKTGVTYPFLVMRDFAKRIAAIARPYDTADPVKRCYWMGHRHSMFIAPVHGFCDFFLPGEQYASGMFNDIWYYVDTLDEKAWRVDSSSKLTGVPHIFLPEFQRGSGKKEHVQSPQPTESLLAMLSVNDINTYASYTHYPTVGDWWAVRDKCPGIRDDDVKFIDYWRPACPVKAITDKAMASVYISPKGITIPIANTSENNAEVTVKVDFKALRIPNKKYEITDARTDKKLEWQGDSFVVSVKPRNYTYVYFKTVTK